MAVGHVFQPQTNGAGHTLIDRGLAIQVAGPPLVETAAMIGAHETRIEEPVRRRRGRPPGSKNKKKRVN